MVADLRRASSQDFDVSDLKAAQRWAVPYLEHDGGTEYYEKENVTTFGKGGDENPAEHGIGLIVAILFLLGEMCGGGVIAMPYALAQSSWYGIATIVIGAIVSGYTGIQLGWCWTILQETWPEYKRQTRKPYPEIGFRAGGLVMKYFVQVCVNFTVFGTSVAFLVLASQNIQLLVTNWFGYSLNYCWLLIVVSAFLLPFTMLGTPKDFWPVAIGAIAATSTAVILIVVGVGLDAEACYPTKTWTNVTFVSFIQSYGTIAFAYGGHSAFPTIQHDMKKPAIFPKVVLYGYIVIFLLYFPMPVFGYMVYGKDVQSPVYYSISTEWVQDAVTLLITGHVLFAYFIYMSPICQDLEDVIGIPKYFSWKRICTRTFMVLVVLFIGLTIPDFSTLLNVIGGTTISAMTFICPGPLYLALRYKTQGKQKAQYYDVKGPIPQKTEEISWYSHISVYGSRIAWWEWLINGTVVLLGTFGAAATIYAAVDTWQAMAKPCYYSSVSMKGVVEGLPANFTFCNSPNYTMSSTYLKNL